MAIAFDNATTQTGTTNLSFSYTVGSASGRFIWVALTTNNNTTTPSVTYNGVSMTFLSGISTAFVFIYYLYNPSSGANTLAVTVTPTGSVTRAEVASYTGVTGTTPDASGSSSGTSATASVSLTTTVANDWLVAMASFGGAGGTPLSSGGSTVRSSSSADGEAIGDSTSGVGAAGSHSIAFGSGDAASHAWNIWALAISPAVTTSSPVSTLAFLGAG